MISFDLQNNHLNRKLVPSKSIFWFHFVQIHLFGDEFIVKMCAVCTKSDNRPYSGLSMSKSSFKAT